MFAAAAAHAGAKMSKKYNIEFTKMEIKKYIITYKIGNDIPINPDWIREQLQAAVNKLQAEIDKKPLNGQHVLELK